jgi:hypothetical protein
VSDANDPHAPQKKGVPGCLIAALVIVGAGLVVCGGGAAFTWWKVSQDPHVRATVGGVKDMAAVAAASTSGPGPDLLRYYGCKQAVVIDGTKMNAAFKRMGNAVDAGVAEAFIDEAWLATCTDAPANVTCDGLAGALAPRLAMRPPQHFGLRIGDAAGHERCIGSYDAAGRAVK